MLHDLKVLIKNEVKHISDVIVHSEHLQSKYLYIGNIYIY